MPARPVFYCWTLIINYYAIIPHDAFYHRVPYVFFFCLYAKKKIWKNTKVHNSDLCGQRADVLTIIVFRIRIEMWKPIQRKMKIYGFFDVRLPERFRVRTNRNINIIILFSYAFLKKKKTGNLSSHCTAGGGHSCRPDVWKAYRMHDNLVRIPKGIVAIQKTDS